MDYTRIKNLQQKSMTFKLIENSFDLTRETKDCIIRYQIIYKSIIKGANIEKMIGIF
jgi:hypothetical protein